MARAPAHHPLKMMDDSILAQVAMEERALPMGLLARMEGTTLSLTASVPKKETPTTGPPSVKSTD